MSISEDVQYIGGYHDACVDTIKCVFIASGDVENIGGCSVHWGDTMSTSGHIMSTSEDVQYIGGYHQYIGGYHQYIGGYHEYMGGCSVHWGRGDIMSTSAGYHKYIRGIS